MAGGGASPDGSSKQSSWANLVVFVSAVVACLGVGFVWQLPGPSTAPIDLLASLHRRANSVAPGLKFALGYNVCLDAIVRWREVLDPAEVAAASPADPSFLSTADEVHGAFRHYFSLSAAAERSADPAVFAKLVDAAMAAPSQVSSLGGNAALMARKLSTLSPNITVTVNGHIGPGALKLLPAAVKTASPPTARDEVHLILEYSKGETLPVPAGAVTSTRANRFIVTADESNLNAKAMVTTITAADEQQADVLVVAGLHMMEPLPAAQRAASIADIAAALAERRTPFAVHVELASAADADYMRLIAAELLSRADSVGFNEQEAAFLYESLGGGYGGVDQPASRAAVASLTATGRDIGLLLRYLRATLPSVSRWHFHSILYHVTAYATPTVGTKWRANAGATAAGAAAATTDACRQEVAALNASHVDMLASLVINTTGYGNPHANFSVSSLSPVARWVWDNTTFFAAPIPVCRRPATTVGLGDAISAAGLAADAIAPGGVAIEHHWETKWPGLKLINYVTSVVRGRVQALVDKLRARSPPVAAGEL